MINAFTIHWGNEEYLEATAMLENLLTQSNPSLLCLWNLAYLHYYGFCEGNFKITSNEERAIDILTKISQYDKSKLNGEGEIEIVSKVVQMLNHIKQSNEFAETGNLFHELFNGGINEDTIINLVYSRLDKLRLKSGKFLGLKIATGDAPVLGDESKFYVYNNEGNSSLDVLDSLEIQPSKMTAWQIYLLQTSPTIMPVFWHGGYIVRKFIFNEKDIEDIHQIKHLDFSFLKEQNKLLPSVEIEEVDGKYIAHIQCCYWNDWTGLAREYARVVMEGNKVISYDSGDKNVFYKYDCGIFF
jgi:hypothetical protein